MADHPQHYLDAIRAAFGPAAQVLADRAVDEATAAESRKWFARINAAEKDCSDEVRAVLKGIVIDAIDDCEEQ